MVEVAHSDSPTKKRDSNIYQTENSCDKRATYEAAMFQNRREEVTIQHSLDHDNHAHPRSLRKSVFAAGLSAQAVLNLETFVLSRSTGDIFFQAAQIFFGWALLFFRLPFLSGDFPRFGILPHARFSTPGTLPHAGQFTLGNVVHFRFNRAFGLRPRLIIHRWNPVQGILLGSFFEP